MREIFVPQEKTFTLEFSKRELNTLYIALGQCPNSDIERDAKDESLETVPTGEGPNDGVFSLYKELKSILGIL